MKNKFMSIIMGFVWGMFFAFLYSYFGDDEIRNLDLFLLVIAGFSFNRESYQMITGDKL